MPPERPAYRIGGGDQMGLYGAEVKLFSIDLGGRGEKRTKWQERTRKKKKICGAKLTCQASL